VADNTPIEWADATANFLNGCSVLSPGCTNCYAMRLAGTRMKNQVSRAGLTRPSKAGPVWTGEVRPHWPALAAVLGWSRPRMIFWNAHGDIGHDAVSDDLIDANVAAIALTPQHTHQLLTKRSPRMREYFHGLDREGGIGRVARFAKAMNLIYEHTRHRLCRPGAGVPVVPHPLPNLWMGVSAEDQPRWDERVADLRQINAAVRWVSGEPLLGPIVDTDRMRGIDWLVVGGESGPRPMHPDWARGLRDQCAAAGVAFHFKQWGAWKPFLGWKDGVSRYVDASGSYGPENIYRFGDGQYAVRVGKKAAGRELDGREWNEVPQS